MCHLSIIFFAIIMGMDHQNTFCDVSFNIKARYLVTYRDVSGNNMNKNRNYIYNTFILSVHENLSLDISFCINCIIFFSTMLNG
jgi:hypothetical protein